MFGWYLSSFPVVLMFGNSGLHRQLEEKGVCPCRHTTERPLEMGRALLYKWPEQAVKLVHPIETSEEIEEI